MAKNLSKKGNTRVKWSGIIVLVCNFSDGGFKSVWPEFRDLHPRSILQLGLGCSVMTQVIEAGILDM